jgi:restriction endonuclease Mrr
MEELRQAVTAELLDMLSQVSPEYFEKTLLDLLHKWGTARVALISFESVVPEMEESTA